MPVVTTGLLSAPVPGMWRRIGLISDDGTLQGLDDDLLVGQLEEMGIPRHQLGFARVLQSWQRARVPPDIAFALWLLRQQHEACGCLYRRTDIRIEESSPAIRYTQLAGDAGESPDTDPTLHQVIDWLLDRQLPDGSIPLVVAAGHGETGQTARTLRALDRLPGDVAQAECGRMAHYLLTSSRPQEAGVAWSYSDAEETVVTGSTSLTVVALVERGCRDDIVRQALDYLLAAQDSEGGWAEVPGYRATVHNTFNVVRALHAAQAADVLDDDPGPCLDAAHRWFDAAIDRSAPRSTLDLAFSLRLAVQFDMLHDDRVESLARRLAHRRRKTLHANADLYAETEIAAIALLECSRQLDARPGGEDAWPWRWDLPVVSPPFLASEGYFYELLYGALDKRWWVRFVDRLLAGNVLERTAGLLFGTIAALGVVTDGVVAAFTLSRFDAPHLAALAVVVVLVAAWIGVKAAARSLAVGSAWATVAAVGVAAVLTWILAGPTPLVPDLLPVVAVRWLVVDAVAFTADRTGVLERLLPKP
jgi:hypothetical protein